MVYLRNRDPTKSQQDNKTRKSVETLRYHFKKANIHFNTLNSVILLNAEVE